MDATRADETIHTETSTGVERVGDHELVVRRTVNGPARLVFEAWTKAELFERWWVPKSFPIALLSCEIDARVGGRYRLVFGHEGSTMEFFGRYLEVTPNSRLVWTNEEGEGETITTVTFEEVGGRTHVAVSDLYPSDIALEEAVESGSTNGMPESLAQLDELLVTLGASGA